MSTAGDLTANIKGLRTLVTTLRNVDYEEEATLLEKDLDETEAIMKGL